MRAHLLRVVDCAMLYRVMRSASRFVLAAMLITFLSPAFGWHALATHDEIEHITSDAGAAHAHEEGQTTHDESDAHHSIGHVLGHLPACFSAGLTVPSSMAASSVYAYVASDWPHVSLEPPLRPPRFF